MVNKTNRKRVLILCTGNVARSQMAEGLLRHIAGDRFEVFSAGLLPSYVRPNAITVMNELGIDISHHRSQALTQKMLDDAFAVICMTESHRAMIQVQADPVPPNLFLFRQFLPGDGEREIGDPYGGPLQVYESARDEMVEAIPALVAHLKTLIADKAAG